MKSEDKYVKNLEDVDFEKIISDLMKADLPQIIDILYKDPTENKKAKTKYKC